MPTLLPTVLLWLHEEMGYHLSFVNSYGTKTKAQAKIFRSYTQFSRECYDQLLNDLEKSTSQDMLPLPLQSSIQLYKTIRKVCGTGTPNSSLFALNLA